MWHRDAAGPSGVFWPAAPHGQRRDEARLRDHAERPGPDGDGSDGHGVEGHGSHGDVEAGPEARAKAICLRLLTSAPRTRAQLAEALRRRGIPDHVADAVLERFSEVGLVDDEAFAAAWVNGRHAGRGLARGALAQELRRRGVAEEIIEQAVGALPHAQEVDTARALVARKLASTRQVDPYTRLRRLVGMLTRKGYSPSLAFRIVREALETEGVELDDLLEDQA